MRPSGAANAAKKLTIVYEPYQLVGFITPWNDSGVGSRSGGADGIRKYCRTKSIVAERVAMKKEAMWYPYRRRKGTIVGAAGRFLSARDWRRRLGR